MFWCIYPIPGHLLFHDCEQYWNGMWQTLLSFIYKHPVYLFSLAGTWNGLNSLVFSVPIQGLIDTWNSPHFIHTIRLSCMVVLTVLTLKWNTSMGKYISKFFDYYFILFFLHSNKKKNANPCIHNYKFSFYRLQENKLFKLIWKKTVRKRP